MFIRPFEIYEDNQIVPKPIPSNSAKNAIKFYVQDLSESTVLSQNASAIPPNSGGGLMWRQIIDFRPRTIGPRLEPRVKVVIDVFKTTFWPFYVSDSLKTNISG